MIADWLPWVKMAGELLPEVIGWLVDLAKGGDADPASTVRREIADRRAEVAANRAAVDAALLAKHAKRAADETQPVPTVPTLKR